MTTYEELKKVNESIKTVDIKGKNYAQVNERVKAFRQLHPNGSIETEIVERKDGVVTMKAVICDGGGHQLATGFANEKETSSYINKTSFIENCETSAVGRALGFVGIGIDLSVASAEEMQNAEEQSQPPIYVAQSQFGEKVTYLQKKGMSLDEIGSAIGVNNGKGIDAWTNSFQKLVELDRALYNLCAEKSK